MRADVDAARRHHELHGDMDGDVCLLSRCALHYPVTSEAAMTPVPFTPEQFEQAARPFEREAEYVERKRPDPFMEGEPQHLQEIAAMLRQAAAQARELAALRMGADWLEDVIAKSEPQPPGGQHVEVQRYNMTISTRQELRRIVAALRTP